MEVIEEAGVTGMMETPPDFDRDAEKNLYVAITPVLKEVGDLLARTPSWGEAAIEPQAEWRDPTGLPLAKAW